MDRDFYSRHWYKRRYRTMDFTSPGVGLASNRTLNRSTSPSRTVVSVANTPFGGLRHTIDRNNALQLALNRNLRSSGTSMGVVAGGPFWSECVEITPPTEFLATWVANDGIQVTEGSAFPSSDFLAWNDQLQMRSIGLPSFPTDDLALRGWGATGISRTIPTQPEVSLSTSIAELKDGLPNLIGSQLMRDPSAISAAGEYLNFQFGIAPVVSDVTDVIALTKRYESILKQFKRDNGRHVRRRVTLVDRVYRDETSTEGLTHAACGTWQKIVRPQLYADNVTRTRKGTERIWFSAAYKLAYPVELDSALQQIIEFNRVFGVIPTPELAWDLLPMSFLVDWFTNVGDVIHNVSYLGSATSLAYAYVMCEQKYEHSVRGQFGPDYYWLRTDPRRVDLSATLRHTRKRRLQASPFGFTTDFGSLTSEQKSILTALGVSRLRM